MKTKNEWNRSNPQDLIPFKLNRLHKTFLNFEKSPTLLLTIFFSREKKAPKQKHILLSNVGGGWIYFRAQVSFNWNVNNTHRSASLSSTSRHRSPISRHLKEHNRTKHHHRAQHKKSLSVETCRTKATKKNNKMKIKIKTKNLRAPENCAACFLFTYIMYISEKLMRTLHGVLSIQFRSAAFVAPEIVWGPNWAILYTCILSQETKQEKTKKKQQILSPNLFFGKNICEVYDTNIWVRYHRAVRQYPPVTQVHLRLFSALVYDTSVYRAGMYATNTKHEF